MADSPSASAPGSGHESQLPQDTEQVVEIDLEHDPDSPTESQLNRNHRLLLEFVEKRVEHASARDEWIWKTVRNAIVCEENERLRQENLDLCFQIELKHDIFAICDKLDGLLAGFKHEHYVTQAELESDLIHVRDELRGIADALDRKYLDGTRSSNQNETLLANGIATVRADVKEVLEELLVIMDVLKSKYDALERKYCGDTSLPNQDKTLFTKDIAIAQSGGCAERGFMSRVKRCGLGVQKQILKLLGKVDG